MRPAAVAALIFMLGSALPPARAAIEPPVLRVSLESEPLTLDWHGYVSSTDRFLVSFLMRGLLRYDASNQPVCDLCKSFSAGQDGKIFRFELDPAVEWSDGVKLEARHFVDSFKRLLAPGNRFKAAADFRAVEDVRADGKHRLEISLREPDAVLPHLLTTIAAFPIRKELLKGKRSGGEAHASSAVLGPYQLAAWERGRRIVIEGNPRYAGSRPVYRVDFVLGSHAQALARFKAGKLDILSGPTRDDLLATTRQAPRLQVNPYWATRNLIFNIRSKRVADPAVRRAILHALDRDTLPAFAGNGERRVTGLIPPGLPGYRELPLATADAARAKTQPVRLNLLLRDLESERRVGEWLTSQLDRIQVKLDIKALAGGAFYRALESGAFDIALTVWTFDIASPAEILKAFATHREENRGHFTHVGFDAQLGQLLRERNPAEAATLLDQLTQILEVKDVAVIPLGYPTQPFMLGQRVSSFAITPFGDPDLVRIQLKP